MASIQTWPGWQKVRKLGSGSFGSVYEIQRIENGVTYQAALKVITIPTNESDVTEKYHEGMDEQSVTEYFRKYVDNITQEFALMSHLKGLNTIVSYEDHMVVQHDDGIGWDILIRMELLTPLAQYAAENKLDEMDVIRMGLDLCEALSICHKQGIIHRDIKPGNIFVHDYGYFKLGDFGIARTMESASESMSQKGTFAYMAPEVFHGRHYDMRADIYSLGMVLYSYLNENRMPFLPPAPTPYTPMDRNHAIQRRIAGESVPDPVNGSPEIQAIVKKALSYRGEERYENVDQMKDELEYLWISRHGVRKQDIHKKESETGASATVNFFDPDGSRTKKDSDSSGGNKDKYDTETDAAGKKNRLEPDADTKHKKRFVSDTQSSNNGRNGGLKKVVLIVGIIAFLIIVGSVTMYQRQKSWQDEVAENTETETDDTTATEEQTDVTDVTEDSDTTDTGDSNTTGTQDTDDFDTAAGELSVVYSTNLVLVGDEVAFNVKAGDWILEGQSNSLHWDVEDKSIASISSSGVLEALAAGTINFSVEYEGQTATGSVVAAEVDVESGMTVEADTQSITLSRTSLGEESTETEVTYTLIGNIPEHWNAYYYKSPECTAYCEWLSAENNTVTMQVEPGLSEGEGVLTVFIVMEDDPEHVLASCKINIKIV